MSQVIDMASVRRFTSEKAVERHFFRSLQNTRELRHNPLVLRLFEQTSTERTADLHRRLLARIRDAVRDGARSLLRDPSLTPRKAQRQCAIIQRCDLETVPHKVVAADLGVCERQFYRERADAMHRVAEFVRQWAARDACGNARSVDVYSLELGRATVLQQAGQFEDALADLQRLADHADGGVRRAHALCRAADLRAELRAFDAAQRCLDAAREAIHADGESEDGDRHVALAIVHLGCSTLAESRGTVDAIDLDCEQAEQHAQKGVGGDAALLSVARTRTALLRATHSHRRGDTLGAARCLGDAREILDQMEHPPAFLMGEYFRRTLGHHIDRGADNATVVEAYAQALDVVEQNGLAVEAARTISTYAAYLSLRGEIEEARRHLHACLAMDALSPTQTYTDLLLAAADVECSAGGDPASAIQLTTLARNYLSPGTFDWANTHLIEAMARLSLGEYAGVIGPISTALETFRSVSSERYAGGAMRILAQAYAATGRTTEAASLIGDAIDQLRDHANPRQLYFAYEASASITGSRAHAQEARRLKRAI